LYAKKGTELEETGPYVGSGDTVGPYAGSNDKVVHMKPDVGSRDSVEQWDNEQWKPIDWQLFAAFEVETGELLCGIACGPALD
jgi:hypothetical protein